jgi:prepilin-type N-terminal cleavage/methylation domain-containing protein
MKLQGPVCGLRQGSPKTARGGFTLTEILFALAIFGIVVVGILSANLLGLRMMQVNETKLAATEWSRNTFGKLTEEIHSCNAAYIGNMTNGFFTGLLDGEPQQGDSLMIYPTASTTNYVLYFLNPSDQTFRRTTGQTNTAVVLADSVTNNMIFTAEGFSNNVLTTTLNNRVIHVRLDIYQPEHYLSAPDYYQLETSVTRRALQ